MPLTQPSIQQQAETLVDSFYKAIGTGFEITAVHAKAAALNYLSLIKKELDRCAAAINVENLQQWKDRQAELIQIEDFITKTDFKVSSIVNKMTGKDYLNSFFHERIEFCSNLKNTAALVAKGNLTIALKHLAKDEPFPNELTDWLYLFLFQISDHLEDSKETFGGVWKEQAMIEIVFESLKEYTDHSPFKAMALRREEMKRFYNRQLYHEAETRNANYRDQLNNNSL